MMKIQPPIPRKNTLKKHPVTAKSILVGLVALLLFSLLLSSVIALIRKYQSIQSYIQDLKQEQVALKEKQAEVTQMNTYIETPEGKERIFREKYRLIKPGEGMIIVTNENDAESNAATKKPALQRFWERILTALGIK